MCATRSSCCCCTCDDCCCPGGDCSSGVADVAAVALEAGCLLAETVAWGLLSLVRRRRFEEGCFASPVDGTRTLCTWAILPFVELEGTAGAAEVALVAAEALALAVLGTVVFAAAVARGTATAAAGAAVPFAAVAARDARNVSNSEAGDHSWITRAQMVLASVSGNGGAKTLKSRGVESLLESESVLESSSSVDNLAVCAQKKTRERE